MSTINLLQETKTLLESHGKCIFDVEWFGIRDTAEIEGDIQEVFSVDYDNGYGGHEVPLDLVVVGNGWWLERWEYDGSEGWEFNNALIKPEKTLPLLKLGAY